MLLQLRRMPKFTFGIETRASRHFIVLNMFKHVRIINEKLKLKDE